MNQIHTRGKERYILIRDKITGLVPFFGLIVVCAFFQLTTNGRLISASNFKTFSNYAFQMIIPACGAVFLMAQGNIDFSMAGNVCISAALGAMASHIHPVIGVAVAIGSSIIMGCLNGCLHVYLGVSAFIATLASSFVYSGFANVLLGGGSITSDYTFKKADTLLVKYGIILVAVLVTWVVLTYTPFGKRCCAIGAREEVAHQSGVAVRRTKMIPFLICGFSCGILAVFSLIRTCSASTTTGSNTQVNAMLALLLGGVPFSGGWASKFRCVIIGGLMMAVVTDGLVLMNASIQSQQIIKGVLFIVAVAISFDRKNTAVIK